MRRSDMKRALTTAAAIVAMTLAAFAASAEPTLTGNWTMAVEGGPHGNATMALALKQDGDKVTGSFVTGHTADMPIAGTFVNGELKLETTSGEADSKVIFGGRLKEDGTLAGYISSPVGDMKWTASRDAAKSGK